MISKIVKIFKNPKVIILYLLSTRISRIIPDTIFLKIKYRIKVGKVLNLSNPKTFNEKLQWLKLYDRKPEYTDLVDKYKVRDYIAKTIGSEYLVPLLGVYNSFEEINFDKLPNQFVLKPNHTSGDIFICRDKSKIIYNELNKKVNKWLKRDYYLLSREWCYKNIKPRIICEKLLKTEVGRIPIDYKFHCFKGVADNVMLCTERETGKPKFYFFDKKWYLLRYNIAGVAAPENFTLPKPKKIDEMFKIAEILSKDKPFVRVDLFYEFEKIYFSELTLYPQSGFDKNLLDSTDILFGSKIRIK